MFSIAKALRNLSVADTILTIKMDSSTKSLLCEENLQIDSPWSKDLNTHCIDHSDSTSYHDFPYYTGHVGSCSTLPFVVPEDYDEAIKICLEKESAFMPSEGYYLQHLRASELCDTRRRAIYLFFLIF